MLQIKNLTITHKKDLKTLIRDFTWALNPGDKAAVIGEEGNGKSTFLKLLYDPELVEDYVEYSGEILKGGLKLGYLPQELDERCKSMSLLNYFEESAVFYNHTYKELARIGKTLDLDPELFYSDQRMGTLSGGEKVKAGMARILMDDPDVLLLDEPSNDIDLETLTWLEDFIKKCEKPIVYVSHDETLLENTANVVLHFEQLRRKTLPRYTVARTDYGTYVRKRLSKMEHQAQMARKEESDYKKTAGEVSSDHAEGRASAEKYFPAGSSRRASPEKENARGQVIGAAYGAGA